MQKVLFYIFFLFFIIDQPIINDIAEPATSSACHCLYQEMKLNNILNYKAFDQALAGYSNIETLKKGIITIIDFSKPSTEKRLYVLDLRQKKILFWSYVAHGRNSGDNMATSFSNENGSYKSSLGFFVTENTYQGKNGYSLILNGLEKGINDHAKDRSIVIHGANYCNPSVIPSLGRLGRSYGCPALPEDVSESIINTIKDGTLLYIYAENQSYQNQSTILGGHTIIL